MTPSLEVAQPEAAPASNCSLAVAISGMPERRKGNKMSSGDLSRDAAAAAINGGIEYQLMASPTITEREAARALLRAKSWDSYTVIIR